MCAPERKTLELQYTVSRSQRKKFLDFFRAPLHGNAAPSPLTHSGNENRQTRNEKRGTRNPFLSHSHLHYNLFLPGQTSNLKLEASTMSSSPQPQKSGSFGERLRREREMRGIKLEEISESTKIGKRNLVALEEERFDQLPGGIFNKGFVRAYAKFLGLDEEQAVNDFLAASANYEQPAALAPPPRAGSGRDADTGSPAAARNAAVRAALASGHSSRPGFSPAGVEESAVKPPAMPSDAAVRRRQRLWALSAAVVLVIGLALWFKPAILGLEKFSRRQPNSSESSAANPKFSGQGISSPADARVAQASPPVHREGSATVPVSNQGSGNAASAATTTSQSAPDSPAASSQSENTVKGATNPAEKSSQPGTAAAPTGAKSALVGDPSPVPHNSRNSTAASDSITLDIHATSEVWISALSDGVSVLNFTLRPGETRQLRASNHLILKTGNAAALEVSFNGKPLPPLGKDKQVRTLTFTPSGLQ
jgi:cytoskeletal protein RodZ